MAIRRRRDEAGRDLVFGERGFQLSLGRVRSVQANQWGVGQVGDADSCSGREGVGRWHDADGRDGIELGCREAAGIDLIAHEGQVEFALEQAFAQGTRAVYLEPAMAARVVVREAGDGHWHHAGGHCVQGADAQYRVFVLAEQVDLALDGVEADIDAFDFVHQRGGLGGRDHAALAAVEQSQLRDLLELQHGLGDRRLADMQRLGCAARRAEAHDHAEYLDLPGADGRFAGVSGGLFHVDPISSSY